MHVGEIFKKTRIFLGFGGRLLLETRQLSISMFLGVLVYEVQGL